MIQIIFLLGLIFILIEKYEFEQEENNNRINRINQN